MRKCGLGKIFGIALVVLLAMTSLGSPPRIAAQSEGTEVGGIISENTTWTVADSPYIATNSVLVSEGVTLTIEPGVTIKFNSNLALQIDGELVAQGTEENPIIFTSNETSPAAGDWGYILFSDKSKDASYDEGDNYVSGSIMEHCIVEYAGSSTPQGAIRVINSSPFISCCIIKNNANGGIHAEDTNYLHIVHNTVSNNEGSGIYVDDSNDGKINYNLIRANKAYGDGGGIAIDWDTRFNITDNIVMGNSAEEGGGIYFDGYDSEISGNIIVGNHASGAGAGIYGYFCNSQFTANSLIGNTAPHGAAICCRNYNSEVAFASNTIIGNEATSGGAVELPGGVSFNNNNLWDNEAFNLCITSEAGTTLDATNDYWGRTDETEIAETIYDFFDDSSKGAVNYHPYLIEPDTIAPPSPPTGLEAATSLVDETASINLSWNANPESDIIGYKVYYATDIGFPYNGTEANEGNSPIDVGNITSFTLSGLSPGETYYLALTAYDAEAESWYSEEVSVYAGLLQADFSASPTQALPDTTIQFTNLSQGGVPPYTYEWDFDNDGEIDSTEENPSYTYDVVGEYTVSVTVTDSLGNKDTKVRENYITIAEEIIGLQTRLLAVMPDSDYYTPADLRYVDIGYPASAQLERDMLSVALDTYDIGYHLESVPSEELLEELQEGNIEAALVPQHPWAALATDGSETEVRFLPWNAVAIEAVQDAFSRVYSTQLPANTYPWQAESMPGYAYIPLKIYVDDNFEDDPDSHKWNTINEGLADASDGDIIIVYGGTYHEHVTLDKSVTLKTDEGATIDGGGTLSTVTINADGCTISGFNITGSGSRPNENAGIRVNSDYNTISDNTISGNKQDGIWLSGRGNTIGNSNISNNGGSGLYVARGSKNTIKGNAISDSKNYGIYLSGEGNILRDNAMSSNNRNFAISYDYAETNDVDTSNTVDGKPIYYLLDEQDMLIDSATNAGYIVAVNSQNITIKDLTLTNNDNGVCLINCQNCLLDNVAVQDNDNGIYLRRCSNTTVKNCTASGNEVGICLSSSGDNIISSNRIQSNSRGIYLGNSFGNTVRDNQVLDNDSTGISLNDSDGNLIADNTSRSNRFGVILSDSYDNTVENNFIGQNERTGVEIESSRGNLIYRNTIFGNGNYGMSVSRAEDNVIHHNNFIDNGDNAWSEVANSWDDGSEGNYWSDYRDKYPDAKEIDETGIWDTPYEIPGEAGAIDNYPLTEPYSVWDSWVYDKDSSGYIEIGELLDAISDYISSEINISQLLKVINLYISHTQKL